MPEARAVTTAQRSTHRRGVLLRLAALAAAGMIALGTCAVAFGAEADTLAGRSLLQALKAGGLIVYFRHASTDFGQNDEQMTGFEDCSHQRNLTEVGRQEARAIGAAMERLALPVGDVLASPFCRTMETARLIFGRAVTSSAVRGGPASGVDSERYAELRKLLSSIPAPGTDLVIVSHGNPFRAVSDATYLAEGEAAVIRPLGPAGFRIIARIPKDGWDSLGAP